MKFRFEVDRGADEFFEDYLKVKFSSEFEFSHNLFIPHYVNQVVMDVLNPLISDFDRDFLKGEYSGDCIESDRSYEMESLLICYMYCENDLSERFFELLLFFYSEKYGSVVRRYMRELLV